MNSQVAAAMFIAVTILSATSMADLIWDSDPQTAGVQEGSGIWQDGGAANWWDGSQNVTWSNAAPTVAQFGNANSTSNVSITVHDDGVTATGLTFRRSHTLQGGRVTLSEMTPVVSFFAGANSATTATLSSDIHVTDDDSETDDDLIVRGGSPIISNSYWKVILGGTNDYSGKLILEDGVLCDINSTTALSGAGIVVNEATTLRILASEGTFGAGQTLELNGYGFGYSGNLHNSRAALMLSPTPSGTLTWAGDIILTGDASIASTQTVAGTVNTISGDISGNGKLVKNSNTTLALTGTCTHTGGTDVYRNVLQVDGTLGTIDTIVTVGTGTYSDATLKGTGLVLGDVLVNSVGTIEAGDSVGTLTVNGDVTINGKFKIEYDSVAGEIDTLIVDGDLDLGGATLSFGDVAEAPGLLASGTGPYIFATYTGTLTRPVVDPIGVPEGLSIAWAYGGNSIALVPEPTSLVMLVLLALATAGWRRRP